MFRRMDCKDMDNFFISQKKIVLFNSIASLNLHLLFRYDSKKLKITVRIVDNTVRMAFRAIVTVAG